MSQISAVDQVFNFGGEDNPNNIIFGDFLQCDKAYWSVSKAFLNANRNALVRVGEEITLCDRVSNERTEESAALEARLPQLFADFSRKMEAYPRAFNSFGARANNGGLHSVLESFYTL